MVYTVRADSIATAWIKTVLLIDKNGVDVPTEYGNNAHTLVETIVVHITDPTLDPKTCDELSDFKSKAIEKYCEDFLFSGETGHTYTYPNRLFDYPWNDDGEVCGDGNGYGYNQIEHIIDALNDSKISRRQIAHTWHPPSDMYMEHCPCLQTVQFHILNNKLRLFATFRSNDMLDAALANNNGLHTLQKYVANSLGINTGYMEIYSCNPHIYCERIDAAKKVVAGAGKYLSYQEIMNVYNQS